MHKFLKKKHQTLRVVTNQVKLKNVKISAVITITTKNCWKKREKVKMKSFEVDF